MRKCLHEKTEWFEKSMNSLGKLSSYDDPSVLASQIHSQREVCPFVQTIMGVNITAFGQEITLFFSIAVPLFS